MGNLRKLVVIFHVVIHPEAIPTLIPLAMLSSIITKNAVKRTSTNNIVSRCIAGTSRSFVQPSGADRANVVDVPSNYPDDNHFAPRQGIQGIISYARR